MKSQRSHLVLALFFSVATICTAGPEVSFDLFNLVKNQPTVALAPVALEDSLSLLYFGSAGETETAFKSVLFPKLSRDEVMVSAKHRKRTFPGYRSVGGLWFDPRLALTDDFQKATTESWMLHVERAPLRTDQEKSAATINTWFGQQTNGRVTNAVTAADFTGNSDLFGLTVTAFVSPWKQAYFDLTQPEWFYFSPDLKTQVPMMKGQKSIPYGETEYLQIVRLDYNSEDISLLLLLPKNATGLTQALASFSDDTFSSTITALKPETLKIWLPKVKYRSRTDWREVLTPTDLAIAFTNKADFSRINANKPEPLLISRIIQEVWIQWDEHGTEARAFTSVSSDPFGGPPPPPPKSFIANHPFAYAIFNRTTREIYFMGIVSERAQLHQTRSE
jgi:serine protease inhibitor